MQNNDNSILRVICHPYIFALKEGREIADNPLDYSLLLLQRNCTEILKSPFRSKLALPLIKKGNPKKKLALKK